MNIDDSTQEKINSIQLYEQNLQSLNSQKQNFQSQALEIESALSELKKSSSAYKIVGNIMVASDMETLKKEMKSKKEMLDVRLQSIDKQEEKLKAKISEAQKEVMDSMKGK